MTEPLTPERRKKGCQPSFLTFFMALPCQDPPPSGDSVPHTSPCTPVPPGTAIQGPLAESNQRAQGITGMLCTRAEKIPYKFPPLLTSQEPLPHLFTPGAALYHDHVLQELWLNLQALCSMSLGPSTSPVF